MLSRHRVKIIGSCVLLLFAPVLLLGQEPAGRSAYDEDVLREARAIYDRVMSPYCPGLLLSNCSSDAADALRHRIRERLAGGETPEAILESLVAEFGESILAEPPKTGFAGLVWLGPLVLLLAGTFVVIFYLRGHTRRPGEGNGLHSADPTLRARIEDELDSPQK